MQSDTTPGLTQGAPGAPDDGHETAFLNVENTARHSVSACSTRLNRNQSVHTTAASPAATTTDLRRMPKKDTPDTPTRT